jgi:AAA+ ATPase superfamily predicted ATPase
LQYQERVLIWYCKSKIIDLQYQERISDMPKQRTNKFIGRKAEFEELERLTKKASALFIVVRGRRRIGKSRLVEEFGKRFDAFYSFMGLAPEKNVTRQHQLEAFSLQIAQQFIPISFQSIRFNLIHGKQTSDWMLLGL